MRRFALALTAGACALVACDSTVTLPAGNLQEPVALTTATDSQGAPIVFIANGSTEDLRAFLPEKQLFARGPNAVSPLSIDVGFRPTRLASGKVGNLGYAVVAGASPQVAMVDAQEGSFRRTHAAADAGCSATPPTPQAACLPAPATDVATAGDKVFAPLSAAGTTGPQLAVFGTAVEANVPVLALQTLLPLTGQPGGAAANATSTTETKVYVADQSAARVIEVTVPGGATRDITAAGPVSDVVLSPAFTAGGTTHAAGEFLLAILADGRLQTLDPATGAPAADPLVAAQPIAPISFGHPVRDVTFVPCDATRGECLLRTSTSEDPKAQPGLGFVALGDGTAIPIVPDPAKPQVYRAVLTSDTTTQVVGLVLNVPGAFNRPTTPVLQDANGTAGTVTTTRGFTRAETWTLTFEGVVPGFSARPATLAEAGGGFELQDVDPQAFATAKIAAGDTVSVSPQGDSCAALAANPVLTVTTVAPGALTVTPPAGTSLAGCAPVRVNYTVRAGGAEPWTVVGTASGFVGRAGMGEDAATAPLFTYAGTRFFYPPTGTNGPALAFKIVGTAPAAQDSTFTFSTQPGFAPLVIGAEQLPISGGGLANAVTATVDRLYIAQVASNQLLQVLLTDVLEATGIKTFQ